VLAADTTDASAVRLSQSDRFGFVWSVPMPSTLLHIDGRMGIEDQQLRSSVAGDGVVLRNSATLFLVNPLRGEPPIGEPDAGDPQVRFGGRGR